MLGALASAASVAPAEAAEVEVDGFYQARGRIYDTLSLARDLPNSEGLAFYIQHRLYFRPRLIIGDQIRFMVALKAFDGALWGETPYQWVDPVTGEGTPLLFSDELLPQSGNPQDGRPNDFLGLGLQHAWGEVQTKIGLFRFGRMPLHWGLGLWQNDGLGLNQDFGDTADRISWEHTIQKVWVRAGVDVHAEGLVARSDDTFAIHAAAAYRTERMQGGLHFQYRRSAFEGGAFDLFTIDGAFDLHFGPVGLAGEVVTHIGGGDLPSGLDSVRVLSVGAVLDASVKLEKFEIHLEGGVATGDGNPNDNNLRGFTFDRDFNVGLFMFEQPLPTLAAAVPSADNGGRSFEVAQTGRAVGNALYLRPRFAYRPVPGLWLEAQLLAARAAKVTDAQREAGRRSYGFEIDLGARYEALRHFELGATFGLFLPGDYYRNYTDDIYSGFRAPAVGGQLLGRVVF
jgi:hypothetical protein